MSDSDTPRRILHERSPSHNNELARVRLVPSTPPRLLGRDDLDDIYSRTPFPTHPSHFLAPGKEKNKGRAWEQEQEQEQEQGSRLPALDDQFQQTIRAHPPPSSSSSSVSRTHTTPQHRASLRDNTPTGSPSRSKADTWHKKRLQIHDDNKTFSLLSVQDDAPSMEDGSRSPTSLLSTRPDASHSLPLNAAYAEDRSNSTKLCTLGVSPATIAATQASQNKLSISADHITSPPRGSQLVGGLRKVPTTPELKHRATISSESPLPPLHETLDGLPPAVSPNLSTKPSFQSTETATTTSENTNYKVYRADSTSASEVALARPSSSGDSNYQVIGGSSPSGSVVYHPQTAPSQSDDFESHGDLSPGDSYVGHIQPTGYSQESLVVLPLSPKLRRRRSSENTLAYYKSRSRESLRTGSLTSISTILSQQEAFRAIVGSGSIIHLPVPTHRHQPQGPSSCAEPPSYHPPRSHMNEHPHQWSSQLSTVLSVSDGGTDSHSRSWLSDNATRSSGYPSSQCRHSRHMLSIGSSASLTREERTLEPPTAAFMRNASRYNNSSSGSSLRIVEDDDEYGDVITDMQDLRARPSRARLSSYIGSSSSDHRRTNTMRSTTSSRANSMLANSIPTWAKLYYGSGERRFLLAPGSSTGGTDSRNNSLRSGSSIMDHYPASIHNPRRRPREGSRGGSVEIAPATEGRIPNDLPASRFRTWSLTSRWSPHLRLDRRAARRSAWEPPVANWSTEKGWFGRRNAQVVMFIVGFIFPFAWMIAAVLPLPPKPAPSMREQDNSTSNLDSSNETADDYACRLGPAGEVSYESAKWWRRLNRWMSVIGLLVIAAVVVLVVIGLKESW
ncbi:hypothetical protein QTJ16_001716 [Diplocarpon rosae]|uniref:Serine-rich protein n=1 Tax=Diplocarpon rosae TaxID=946125 RepID=A0AAD9T204_9HELO|nr:hypothetical protein QTJ16_001716 [Diplocarpon rosae]PBP23863.1 hypothetical protein BUE80_DR005286 [Diplocarpon rosae]